MRSDPNMSEDANPNVDAGSLSSSPAALRAHDVRIFTDGVLWFWVDAIEQHGPFAEAIDAFMHWLNQPRGLSAGEAPCAEAVNPDLSEEDVAAAIRTARQAAHKYCCTGAALDDVVNAAISDREREAMREILTSPPVCEYLAEIERLRALKDGALDAMGVVAAEAALLQERLQGLTGLVEQHLAWIDIFATNDADAQSRNYLDNFRNIREQVSRLRADLASPSAVLLPPAAGDARVTGLVEACEPLRAIAEQYFCANANDGDMAHVPVKYLYALTAALSTLPKQGDAASKQEMD